MIDFPITELLDDSSGTLWAKRPDLPSLHASLTPPVARLCLKHMAKNTTLNDLARMVNEGFKTTATKKDITAINMRLDRIETLLMEKQKREIEDLK
jgi:hypothetical protein